MISAFIAHTPERGKILTDDPDIAKVLSEKGFDVVGITANPTHAKEHAPKAKFYNLNIEDLPFYANNFDAAWLHQPPANIGTLLVIGGVLVTKYIEGEFEQMKTEQDLTLYRKV
jgi:hypothetical protein